MYHPVIVSIFLATSAICSPLAQAQWGQQQYPPTQYAPAQYAPAQNAPTQWGSPQYAPKQMGSPQNAPRLMGSTQNAPWQNPGKSRDEILKELAGITPTLALNDDGSYLAKFPKSGTEIRGSVSNLDKFAKNAKDALTSAKDALAKAANGPRS